QWVAEEKRHLGQGPKATCRHLSPGRLVVADGTARLDATGDDAEVDSVGCRSVAATAVLARATAPHALPRAKGPDGARTPGGRRGLRAASVHPTTHTRGAGRLESVGG